MMPFLKKPINAIISGIVLLLLAYFLYNWWSADVVAAYSVQKQDYVPSLLLSGEVVSESSTLLSSPSAGTVVQCTVKKGDKVQKGQVIVKIDDLQASLDRDRAAAAVQIARSNLQQASTVTLAGARSSSVQADLAVEQAQRQYERAQTLIQAGAISQQELELARQNLNLTQEQARSARISMEALQNNGVSLTILQAELQQRQLDLDAKELLLENFQVRAPFDGEILDLYPQPGELLSVGSKIALLASSAQSRIRIKPDQRYADLAAINNRAQVWIPNDDNSRWPGQVVFTEPSGNADQGYLTAELNLENKVPALYPGRLVSVQLFGAKQKQAIIIADHYLSVINGQSGVWLIRNNRAHFTPLQTGLRTAAGVVVLKGLKAGDLVLNPDGLQENQRVTVKNQRNKS